MIEKAVASGAQTSRTEVGSSAGEAFAVRQWTHRPILFVGCRAKPAPIVLHFLRFCRRLCLRCFNSSAVGFQELFAIIGNHFRALIGRDAH